MAFCSRCGREASAWTTDILSGLCGDCRRADRETAGVPEREAAERRPVAELAARDAGRARRAALHGDCPLCGVPFVPITLVGRTGGPDADVAHYAAADAERGVMFARFEAAGAVRAAACPGCGRIDLRAVPPPRPGGPP